MTRIGTLRENPLHASLKEWYRKPGDLVEHPVDGFVIDLVRDELLVEIQTGSFSKIKRKLTTLLDAGHHVRILHPIAVDKSLVKVDDHGTILDRRLSPRHGSVIDVFSELVSIPELLGNGRFEIEVALVTIDEIRRHVPAKAWRRRGWVVEERRLVDIVDHVVVNDVSELLPTTLPDTFTTKDLSEEIRCPLRIAQQMAYCLRHTGALNTVGKIGNSKVYKVAHRS